MPKLNRKPKSACFVLLAIVAVSGLAPGAPAPQDPQQNPPPKEQQLEEERRKALEKMLKEMQQKQEADQSQTQAKPPQTAEPARPVRPAGRPSAAGNQVMLSYDNADLYDFINQIADMLKITPIVIDPEVKGTVTIHSSAPMSTEDIFPLFNIILKNNNAALVKGGGDIYQIVPISQGLKQGLQVIENLPPPPPPRPEAEQAPAKPEPPPASPPPAPSDEPSRPQTAASANTNAARPQAAPARPEPSPSETPQLATHVIRVEFVPVASLIEPLKLFMTDGGVIMPYERLNMLIVTDYSDSISKILEIIHLLDNSYLDPDLVELVEIKYNASTDVLEDLKKIFGGGKDSTTGIYMVSLDRINAILVMANSRRALEEVKRWIERLDATTGRSLQTFVYTVQNSTASNIAMILSLLFGGEGAAAASAAPEQSLGQGRYGIQGMGNRQSTVGGGAASITPFGSSGTAGARTSGGTFGAGGGTFGGGTFGGGTFGGGVGGYQGGYGTGVFGGGQQLGPRLNQGVGMSAQVLRGGEFTGLQGIVRIVADDINNSLIIQASQADYQYILETIKKMDVLPRQAIIDARIFEIDLTDALSFGISGQLQARTTDQHLTTGSISPETGALSASTFAFVGNSREILLALDALRQKTRVKILEAPSVLALDGTVASINVGSEIPYPGASYVAPAGGATTSVQYRDTGVSLIIMPRISASGTVTLDIAHEVSSPGASTPTGPTFSKTAVSTTLAVKDGESVAIAGLIRESNSFVRAGVPFLSEIPLLGSLFGRTTRSANRTELLILITPHVIRTPERFSEMTQELKDSLRNVRKEVDRFQKEQVEDVEKARKERAEQQGKQPVKPEPQPPKP